MRKLRTLLLERVLFCLIIQGLTLTWADPLVSFPEAWKGVREVDRWNTRSAEERKSSKIKAVPLYRFDIRGQYKRSFFTQTSQHSELRIDSILGMELPAKDSYLLAVDEPGIPFNELVKRYGKPVKTNLLALKKASAASYWVWDPSNPSQDPLVIKFSVHVSQSTPMGMGDKEVILKNDPEDIQIGIHTSDLLFELGSQFRSMGLLPPEIEFVPEVFGAWTKNNHFEYGFLVRSQRGMFSNVSLSKHWPLHGVLSDKGLGIQRSEKSNKVDFPENSRNWVNGHYAYELGRISSILHHLGIFPASHAQNILIQRDDRGKIISWAFHDMPDLMTSPFIVKCLIGKEPITHRLMGLDAAFYEIRSRQSSQQLRKVEWVFLKLLEQSLYPQNFLFEGNGIYNRLLRNLDYVRSYNFLKGYMDAAGFKSPIVNHVMQVLTGQNEGISKDKYRSLFTSFTFGNTLTVSEMLAVAIKEEFKHFLVQILHDHYPQVFNDASNRPLDEKSRKIFLDRIAKGRGIIFPEENDILSRLDNYQSWYPYKPVIKDLGNGNIALLNAEDGKILALSYASSSKTSSAKTKKNRAQRCRPALVF